MIKYGLCGLIILQNIKLQINVIFRLTTNNEKRVKWILTLLTGPKNNNVKQVLGSILTPTLVLE